MDFSRSMASSHDTDGFEFGEGGGGRRESLSGVPFDRRSLPSMAPSITVTATAGAGLERDPSGQLLGEDADNGENVGAEVSKEDMVEQRRRSAGPVSSGERGTQTIIYSEDEDVLMNLPLVRELQNEVCRPVCV